MRLNLPFVLGIGFIAFWVGIAVGSVGHPSSTPCGTPYSWILVAQIAVLLVAPFALGFFAGKEAA